MHRPLRMLDLLSELRAARRALTAADLAARLGVSARTLYRDVAALQAMGVPIDGAAGLGYILRPGFHLPPLNFSPDEAEAIAVGLALLRRTGDESLIAAATRVAAKIAAAQPSVARQPPPSERLRASPFHALPASRTDPAHLRRAVREAQVMAISYRDAAGASSDREILPVAMLYFIDGTVLAGWCRLRRAFRHFRIDRIAACRPTGETFLPEAPGLRRAWTVENPGDGTIAPPPA